MISPLLKVSKYLLIFTITFLGSLAMLFSEDETSWVLAASQFESNVENDATASLIPQYILQNAPKFFQRTVSPEEQFRIREQEKKDEISLLYEKLQDKIFERDSFAISSFGLEDYAENLKEFESEIETIKLDIKAKNDEKSLLTISDFKPIEQTISLWQDNPDSLYTVPKDTEYFNPRDISALISGRIEYAESFISVTAQLAVYPGSVIEVEVQEADSKSAIESLSKRIADSLHSQITNKDEVTLHFSIEPYEAEEKSTVHINGQLVYYQGEETEGFASIDLTEGIYEFYVESPGYEGLAVTHSFMGDETNYDVIINLKPEVSTNFSFYIPGGNGTLFLNTQKMQQTENDLLVYENETTGIVSVNSFPALGEYVNKDGISTWFLLKADSNSLMPLNLDTYSFSFVPNTKNYTDIIETNRKRMYNSYAALIVSLPLYFIANGQYINEYNSWASGKADGNNLSGWETARNITMGASIGLGVNFLVQLGIYIYSANSILPEEVTVGEE